MRLLAVDVMDVAIPDCQRYEYLWLNVRTDRSSPCFRQS